MARKQERRSGHGFLLESGLFPVRYGGAVYRDKNANLQAN